MASNPEEQAVGIPPEVWAKVEEVIPLAHRALYGHRVRPQLRRALDGLNQALTAHDMPTYPERKL